MAKIQFDYINFYWPAEPIPEDYDYHNLKGGSKSRRFIIGAQAEVPTLSFPVDQDVMNEIRDHKRGFYIYGTLVYGDQFNFDHITMYCFQLLDVAAEQVSGESILRGFGMVPCDHHNCIDGDCRNEPRAGLLPPA